MPRVSARKLRRQLALHRSKSEHNRRTNEQNGRRLPQRRARSGLSSPRPPGKALNRGTSQRHIFWAAGSALRDPARPTNGSDRGSLRSHDLTLFVRPQLSKCCHLITVELIETARGLPPMRSATMITSSCGAWRRRAAPTQRTVPPALLVVQVVIGRPDSSSRSGVSVSLGYGWSPC